MDRLFFTEGQNPQGEAVFEQRDVEFPKDWSALATNVVASKYFYGDLANLRLEPWEGARFHLNTQVCNLSQYYFFNNDGIS